MSLKSMFTKSSAAKNSTYRESITTYEFVAELMKALAKRNKKADILNTITGDIFGYDLIIECDGVLKYVQLKAKDKKGTVTSWEVRNSLITNPDGVLIVIYTNFIDDDTWELEYRIWDRTRVSKIKMGKKKTKINEGDLEVIRPIEYVAGYLF